MMECKIVWGCGGAAVDGELTEEIAKRALAPFKNDEHVHESLGHAITLVIVELRAMGVKVVVEIVPGHVLRHTCGRTYTTEQWCKLPLVPCPIPSLYSGQPIVMPTRTCGCGSTIGYGSLEVTHPEQIVCNSRGGSA